jgi:ketosteroid isomerase-like protein
MSRTGSSNENVDLVLDCFAAVERRDEQRQRELFHPQIEFHWPPSLPYGGPQIDVSVKRPSFEEIWDPLQPTNAERRLDPRVVAASGTEVVVLWQQRGVDATGRRFECPVLGLYQIHEGKLIRAQMFYFDTTATADFLNA